MTEVVEIDRYEPDYDDQCQNCGASPTVTAVKDGVVVYRAHLCGPCCWGTADAIDPEEWNQ